MSERKETLRVEVETVDKDKMFKRYKSYLMAAMKNKKESSVKEGGNN